MSLSLFLLIAALCLLAGLCGAALVFLLWWAKQTLLAALANIDARNRAELSAMESRITAAVVEKAFGMMRNIQATKDAEPDVLHPIVERKLAETYLFDLAQGRKTRAMIDDELNGKGQG